MNDLINRHGVAAWLENMGHKKLANYIMDENRFPSESPERKTGTWNMCYDDDAPQDGIWLCSVCGYARLVDDISPQKYCPNCGARMMKEDNEV